MITHNNNNNNFMLLYNYVLYKKLYRSIYFAYTCLYILYVCVYMVYMYRRDSFVSINEFAYITHYKFLSLNGLTKFVPLEKHTFIYVLVVQHICTTLYFGIYI